MCLLVASSWLQSCKKTFMKHWRGLKPQHFTHVPLRALFWWMLSRWTWASCFPLVFLFHLFCKGDFGWLKFFTDQMLSCHPINRCAEGNSKHWPQPGSITFWPHSFLIHGLQIEETWLPVLSLSNSTTVPYFYTFSCTLIFKKHSTETPWPPAKGYLFCPGMQELAGSTCFVYLLMALKISKRLQVGRTAYRKFFIYCTLCSLNVIANCFFTTECDKRPRNNSRCF